jgi:hypothetical protein
MRARRLVALLPELGLGLGPVLPLPERERVLELEPAPPFVVRAASQAQAVPACHRQRRAEGSTTQAVLVSSLGLLLE